jgi:hypothetical protein
MATTQQTAPAQEAGRPQPQTTVEPPGGPFIRHSQPGIRTQYQQTGAAFGATLTNPLVAVPGYIRRFRVNIVASGGAGTSVAGTADAPYNVVSLVTLKDPFGTPLIVGDGYSILRLVNKYGGQANLGVASDPSNLPSYSAIAAASGDFSFRSNLPLEFAKAYGVMSGANASLLPTITWNLSGSGAVYSTAPTTLPTLEVDVDSNFYWLPEGVNVSPPGLGTTCQWIVQACNPSIGSNSSVRVQLPRMGGYLTTLIFVLRDSTNARVEAYPSRSRIYVDGVPLIDTSDGEWKDDMMAEWGAFATGGGFSTDTIETGVRVLGRKTSLNQQNLGLLDTGETYLSTSPGTLIEIEGAPWGAITNSPAQLQVIVGQVVPSGTLIQGLPEM